MRLYNLAEFLRPCCDTFGLSYSPAPSSPSDLPKGLVFAIEAVGRSGDTLDASSEVADGLAAAPTAALHAVEIIMVRLVDVVAEGTHGSSRPAAGPASGRGSKLLVEVVPWFEASAGIALSPDRSREVLLELDVVEPGATHMWERIRDEIIDEETSKANNNVEHPMHAKALEMKNARKNGIRGQQSRELRDEFVREIAHLFINPRKEELMSTIPKKVKELVSVTADARLKETSRYLKLGDRITCHMKNVKWIPGPDWPGASAANADFAAGRRLCGPTAKPIVGACASDAPYATTWGGSIISEAAGIRRRVGPGNIVRVCLTINIEAEGGEGCESWGNYYVAIIHKLPDCGDMFGIIQDTYVMEEEPFLGCVVRFGWQCIREIPHTWPCNAALKKDVEKAAKGYGHSVTGGPP